MDKYDSTWCVHIRVLAHFGQVRRRSKLYFWDENKLRSDIAAEYAYKALVSVAEMSKQYNTIIELLNNIAISEHGNTHEQTE